MSDANEIAGANAPAPKRRRNSGPRKKPSPTRGRKTLIAAAVAAILALADLFLTVRLGIKLF